MNLLDEEEWLAADLELNLELEFLRDFDTSEEFLCMLWGVKSRVCMTIGVCKNKNDTILSNWNYKK